jgi:hypothetical protein
MLEQAKTSLMLFLCDLDISKEDKTKLNSGIVQISPLNRREKPHG